MTQRTEARFKVVNRTNINIADGATMPYNSIVFNEGGTYTTSSATYTIQNAGTYLIGYSHTKRSSNNPTIFPGNTFLQQTRGGISTTLSSSRCATSGGGVIMSNYSMHRFEEGDF